MTDSLIVNGKPESTTDLTDDELASAFRFRIGLSPEEFERVQADLRDLIKLRNRLVHHFLEDFDLRSQAGCEKALSALCEASTRIDASLAELQDWAEDKKRSLSVLNQVQNMIYDRKALIGMAPPWPMTTIVKVLIEAEAELALDGWVSVRNAAAWIAARYPDERPENYRCRSWRQVIHESRRFDLRYRTLDDDRREAWYRSRTYHSGAR